MIERAVCVIAQNELDVRLFDRQTGGYVMADAGEAVYRAAERIDKESARIDGSQAKG